MHAGEALWQLYGSIAMLERLQPANAQTSFLAGKMRSCASVIGAHISVPEPSTVDLGKIMESVSGALPGAGTPASTSSQPPANRRDFRDPEIIKAAQSFVGAMVDSQLFEWADMVSDISEKLQGGGDFFTFKQARALCNIARRGEFDDGTSFMDRMEEEQPEAMRAVLEWADQA